MSTLKHRCPYSKKSTRKILQTDAEPEETNKNPNIEWPQNYHDRKNARRIYIKKTLTDKMSKI